MRTVSIETCAELNDNLLGNTFWANGKNFSVDHLHATISESRWEYENIHGIYLTNENYAWMALWMAVSNRGALRKRHISYIKSSQSSDAVGSIELFTELQPEEALCNEAYLYLVDPEGFDDADIVDIREVPKANKVERLLDQGFERRLVERKGILKQGVVDLSEKERIVLVDEWQVALTNITEIVPDTELAIRRTAIAELAGRVSLTNSEVGEDYIR